MPCYAPLTAYRPSSDSDDRRLVFRKDKAETGVPVQVPCGKCVGCRLEHSRQWAVRCMHEMRMHDASAFVTLTYSDECLPLLHGPGVSRRATLVKADLQNFMKRYRNFAGEGVRFFACGEYGETTLRPHYHLLLLNRDVPDRKFYSRSGEHSLYSSNLLDDIWGRGKTMVGDVTFDSCAYVARYCMKKINGPTAEAHYGGRAPEFIVMSRRPGLGSGYFGRFRNELLSHDTIVVNGVEAALPRYYDNLVADLLPDEVPGVLFSPVDLIKKRRRDKITRAMRDDNKSNRRRVVREKVAMARLSLKRRVL